MLLKQFSLLVDPSRPFSFPWYGQNFDFFGNGIGLAQLGVAVLGLGTVAASGLFVKYHQRATKKYYRSLFSKAKHEMSNIYSVLTRDHLVGGINKAPMKSLNLDAVKYVPNSVALVGDNRSGKTVFLSNTIVNMFPWWYRYIFPPRGFFLIGSQDSVTVRDWLTSQTTAKELPFASIMDLVDQRYDEQWIRVFLFSKFKTKLPVFLRPQPVIIVVDQAEELLRAYRADFLNAFYVLAKKGRDTNMLRLVLVINSENAVKALKLLNGGNMFTFLRAPKVSREAVVAEYGETFAKIFDDCDSCIGIALDYINDLERSEALSAKEFTAAKKEMYVQDNCLTKEITREEYAKVREHAQK